MISLPDSYGFLRFGSTFDNGLKFKENIERGIASIKESLPQYDIYF